MNATASYEVGQNRINKDGGSKCSHLLYLVKSLRFHEEILDTENTEWTGKWSSKHLQRFFQFVQGRPHNSNQ